ncbi:Cysteine proteinase inhibitor [Hibiscus syriacus]|uniref:Cysteine proteinase inhibitor n=2 Tax=Hibiscus syriacus TaxID=106335 RepID=A0A6A2YUY8_HIBSY|nr:Cysteine proteinase inhibitor [Hibiscus syriacus]
MATTTTLGGVCPSHGSQKSSELENLARFADDEHNKKENVMVKFVRVVKASEQVVAGMLHYLTVEAIDAGKKKLYEAKIWVKPWVDFKELQEFKHARDADYSS